MLLYILARIAGKMCDEPVKDILANAETYAALTHPVKKKAELKPESDDEKALVDRLYKIYPTKTFRGGIEVSTGKCSKDKTRLRTLLKSKTPEEIENGIKNYVAEHGGRYLKNFSTFLNNFPEREDISTAIQDDPPKPTYQDA